MEKNKSRIPQLTDSKLKLLANLEQKKTDQTALNIKGSNEQQVASRSKLKPPSTLSRAKSSSDSQTFKTTKVVHGSKGQEKKQAVTSTVTKTPNFTRRKWAPSSSSRRNQSTNRTVKGNVKATLETRPATKPAVRNTTTVQENTRRFIKKPASILGRARDEDEGQQKKLVMSAPAIKRKNRDIPVGRNVRRREALGTFKFDKLNNLRDQNVHLKADLSAAQITKAVAIADRTSLEVEKERLKREHNIQFGEVCQLEHVLACEESKVANLLDKIAKQRSDYLLMAQEKDNLLKNREELEEKNNKADEELDELAKVMAISDTELKEVTTQLDKKLHINANLKSSVDQLRARLDNPQ